MTIFPSITVISRLELPLRLRKDADAWSERTILIENVWIKVKRNYCVRWGTEAALDVGGEDPGPESSVTGVDVGL